MLDAAGGHAASSDYSVGRSAARLELRTATACLRVSPPVAIGPGLSSPVEACRDSGSTCRLVRFGMIIRRRLVCHASTAAMAKPIAATVARVLHRCARRCSTDTSGVATVLGEPLLKRAEALLDGCERVAGPFLEPRKLFTRLPCGLSQQLACVAREDLHVRNKVPHRTLHRLVVARA